MFYIVAPKSIWITARNWIISKPRANISQTYRQNIYCTDRNSK